MSLAVTTEQRDLQASVRSVLDDHCTMTRVRAIMSAGTGHDPKLTALLAAVGVPALPVPAGHDGAGAGYHDLALVFEELGRRLAPTPYLATLGLGVPALLAAGDPTTASRHLPGVAAGELTLTLVGPDDRGETHVHAEGREPHGWSLTGRADLVLDGQLADLLLVLAATNRGDALFAVAATAPGLDRTTVSTLDQSRAFADVTFDGVPARPVGRVGAAREVVSRATDHAAALLAAEMVGTAQACLDMSVAYATTREQFGRPIGSFQAIKHKCAEVFVGIDGARSAARYAGWVATNNPTELAVAAPVAKAAATEALFRAAAENLQVHGGIGMTWEHDAHLFFKRAESARQLFGDLRTHRRRLADRIGI